MSFAFRSASRALLPRAFSTTAAYQKTATETVKDGIRTVDKAVSGKIVDGIDAAGKQEKFPKEETLQLIKNKTESAGQKVKQASESAMGDKSAAGKAEELKGQAKGAAEEAKGKAKGAAEDIKKNL
ncbi:hypothetical protein ISF_00469 [Cordyceps fumosorosea ARSEF 2679]|uniref:LEA domain protein n=1 Tax=Cordyceps fumosorosea (strain ARSEF 2679) TaxID=1081104 RepID=A0A168EA89_CORFA|nr:hypothetical protein ISF_00469 [Cordyceps fumosorosea ARSEF 2679]OAA73568.1 hypothetical protein ISF_00469 [Cordyceps fumosorosea ARSEF 2679]